jgi:hypothetical protein
VNAPAYKVTLENRKEYLYALITGERDSYDVTMGAVTDIAAACKVRSARKLLVEHQIAGRLSALDIYRIATQLPDLFGGVDVGFVIRLATTPENPQFLENVARNRGGQGRLFGNVADAEAWLKSL